MDRNKYINDLNNAFECCKKFLSKNYKNMYNGINCKLVDDSYYNIFYKEDIDEKDDSLLKILKRSSKITIVTQTFIDYGEVSNNYGKIKLYYDLDSNILLEIALEYINNKNGDYIEIYTDYFWGIENDNYHLCDYSFQTNITINNCSEIMDKTYSELYRQTVKDIKNNIKDGFNKNKDDKYNIDFYSDWI